jgi:type VI protein secretion system component VasK
MGTQRRRLAGRAEEDSMSSGFWWAIGGVVGLCVIAAAIVSIVDLFGRHLPRGKTAAWLLLIIILPLAGSALYWALNKPSADEVMKQEAAERSMREQTERRAHLG